MKLEKFTYFYPEAPRLISIDHPTFEQMSNEPLWVAEKKYNENRLQLHYFEEEFQFWNRHGEKFSYRPPEKLLEGLHSLKFFGYCIFDCGLRNNKIEGIKDRIVFYDCLMWCGDLLIGNIYPFSHRRSLIDEFIHTDVDILSSPVQFKGDFRAAWDNFLAAKDPEFEGLVIKNLRGQLNLGRKTNMESSWMYKVRIPSNRYRL
jgi:ATP-dependent DNA ligase